jgi:hypothetical protein
LVEVAAVVAADQDLPHQCMEMLEVRVVEVLDLVVAETQTAQIQRPVVCLAKVGAADVAEAIQPQTVVVVVVVLAVQELIAKTHAVATVAWV